MGATRSVVGLGGMRSPHLITLADQLEYGVVGVDELLAKADNLDGVVLVFALLQLLMIIQ